MVFDEIRDVSKYWEGKGNKTRGGWRMGGKTS
jgi:hypothetical protein